MQRPALTFDKSGLGKIEILFALALLIVGISGVVLAIAAKRAPEIAEAELMTPTMAIEELQQRLRNKPAFLDRILAGKEWIHDETSSSEPVRIVSNGKLFWRCRVSRNLMDGNCLLKDGQPVKTLPDGKYQIAILIYRDWKKGEEQPSIAEYVMMVDTPKKEDLAKKAEDSAKK
jgi:hypothetical protein